MAACPRCSAASETPLGCPSCGALFPLDREPAPFEALGLSMSYRIDVKDLQRRALRLGRLTHPDYFATASREERERAERASAIVNEARTILSDEIRRADWIVRRLGGPDEDEERSMSQEFLLEVLDWNELLERARTDAAVSASKLADLRNELHARRIQSLATIARLLDPLPEPGSETLRRTRRELNAVRYVDRALAEIEVLRLARAEAN